MKTYRPRTALRHVPLAEAAVCGAHHRHSDRPCPPRGLPVDGPGPDQGFRQSYDFDFACDHGEARANHPFPARRFRGQPFCDWRRAGGPVFRRLHWRCFAPAARWHLAVPSRVVLIWHSPSTAARRRSQCPTAHHPRVDSASVSILGDASNFQRLCVDSYHEASKKAGSPYE